MKKREKNDKIKEYSEYVSEGMVEAGKENNIDVQVTNIVKLKQGKLPDSVFVMQHFCQKVAYRKNYSANTFRILMYMFSLSQYENFISIDVKSMAEDLEISEVSVKRATKQLVDDNIVIKVTHPSDKRRIDYFLNPMAAWRGKSLNRDKWLRKANDNKMQLDMFTGD